MRSQHTLERCISRVWYVVFEGISPEGLVLTLESGYHNMGVGYIGRRRRMGLRDWRFIAVMLIGMSLMGASSCGSDQAKPTQEVTMDTLAARNNAFALDLYQQLGEGNLFFSPYSISSALAMTYAGARGKTAEEMARALHFGGLGGVGGEGIHKAFGELTDSLNALGRKGNFKLSVANALWAQEGYEFEAEFIGLTKKYYGAGLFQVDFANDAAGARERINEWVSEKTEGKIQELIGRGLLTPDVRLVLTNAIYFLGNWEHPFKEKRTSDEPFHVDDTTTVTIPMMHQEGHFHYFERDDFQALELPYKGGDLSMVILLPRKVEGLKGLEAGLAPDSLSAWLGRLAPERVDISLPRFKLETKFRVDGALEELGMKDAFEPTRADFSGMTGKRDLFISAVVHKAYVDVNERGTEAAAATGVTMALAMAPTPAKTFRADHPFIFLIKENTTGTILFMGRLVNPAD